MLVYKWSTARQDQGMSPHTFLRRLLSEGSRGMQDCDASKTVRYLSLDTLHRTSPERTQSTRHVIWSSSHSPPRQHRRPAATSTDCTLESSLSHVICSLSEVCVDELHRQITQYHSPHWLSIDADTLTRVKNSQWVIAFQVTLQNLLASQTKARRGKVMHSWGTRLCCFTFWNRSWHLRAWWESKECCCPGSLMTLVSSVSIRIRMDADDGVEVGGHSDRCDTNEEVGKWCSAIHSVSRRERKNRKSIASRSLV